MEMGQAASIDGDVARKAKTYYAIIRQFQNHHMALEKVSTLSNKWLSVVRIFCAYKLINAYQGKIIGQPHFFAYFSVKNL